MHNDQVSSAIWLILGVLISLASLAYGLGTPDSPGTGFMPFVAGMAIAFFALVGFLHSMIKRGSLPPWKPLLRGVKWRRSFIVLAALVAYPLLLHPLGFLLCTAIFIGFLLRTVQPQKWPVVVTGAVATALGAYGIFELWLKAQLPRGPWGF